MITLILVIGSILILAILIALVRVSSLVSITRREDPRVDLSSNRINAVLCLIFLVGSGIYSIYYSYTRFDLYTLPIASEHGKVTDNLFWITTAITGIVFVLTQILLFYFAWRYQYKEKATAYFYPENDRLEIIWTVVPAIVLTVLIFAGLKVWNDIMDEAPQDSEVIEIMGYQFAWSSRYPGPDNELGKYNYRLTDAVNAFGIDFTDANAHDDFMPREIHLPKGKSVLFKIRARDVLHSVFAPHFRLKMDAVPGMPTRFWFVPTKTTEEMRTETGNPDFNYEIACAEICGRGHFSMRMLVIVEELEEYEKWKAEQESWLSKNSDYLARIPEEMRGLANINAGISKQD